MTALVPGDRGWGGGKRLDGAGHGITLTMRQTPATDDDWTDLIRRLFRSFNDAGLLR